MHYGIYLENSAAPLQPPKNKHIFYIKAILQHMYITYIKENFNLFTCFETDLKPASQYCNDSVTHERQNTTQFAQYL